MALESVTAAETLIQSNVDNDDLEDGEIPSDEDDEPVVIAIKPDKPPEPPKESTKSDSSKEKSDSKSSKSKNKTSTNSSSSSKTDRFGKYKNPSEDWAGDVEKAIKAVLDENKSKDSSKSKSSSKSSRSSRSKKRAREEKEERERDEDRVKDLKKRKLSEEDVNINEDDDEMLFVRGASPVRREIHESPAPPPRHRDERSRDRSRDRSRERDSYDRDSRSRSRSRESDERTRDRHRDEKRSNRGASRRSGKSERGSKNKSRSQRNERSGRRNQDHGQDSDSICVYYMQGKCHRGDDCPFSHNALPPRKMELCKFYLMDCCAKRDKCLYMHHDFPCKFFHTGLKCIQGDNCKFSHDPLNDQVKNILLKHLETAPKEILGEFPRLSREGALLMINNTARKLAQGQDASSAKIPSLFDVTLPAPTNLPNEKDDDAPNHLDSAQNRLNVSKDKKAAGKKTRWGSDDDRVPLEQIMLLQSVSQLGLHIPNVALSLAVQQQLQQHILLQQCIANMEFYNEVQGSPSADGEGKGKNKDDSMKNEEEKLQGQKNLAALAKDIDLRQLIANCPKSSILSIANEAANLTKSKFDEESDHDEESDLVIAVPTDEEDKNKDTEKDKDKIIVNDGSTNKESSIENVINSDSLANINQEFLPNLPKTAQELFLRIQQQQRPANESIGKVDDKCEVEDTDRHQEDWYSDDDDNDNDDDDDEEGGSLQIVLKDNLKDESEKSDLDTPTKESPPTIQVPSIPQPAVIVDKAGDVSKIDISAEVTKLLSSIKPHSVTALKKSPGLESPTSNDDRGKETDSNLDKLFKTENGGVSPKSSSGSGSVSRDPRMSRDPRQRRNEDTKLGSPSRLDSKKESRTLRLETSIYSSGIISMDSGMDTDLRSLDQDHRRKDMDLRQRFSQDFGDTDLRVVGSGYPEATRSDVDLRQMLSLPFKPAPSHVPCTEIDASIASHPPVQYKVYVVDIPRPNYTGLKLNKNDALVRYDPRLRKIFRLTQSDIADSPMSPPPAKNIPDTPKSPPQVRTDPRRKALEKTIPTTQVIPQTNMMPSNLGPQQQSQDLSMSMGGPGMQGPSGMGIPLSQNAMLGGIGPMRPMMSGPMQAPNMTPMAMGGMGGNVAAMGPNGPPMGPNQLGYEAHYAVQRNGGPGLLGPAPGLGFSDPRDIGPNFNEGPGYTGNNYGNFGPAHGPTEPMMGFGPGGPNNMNNMSNMNNNMNFGGNNHDWPTGNANQVRRGGRVRRRNRNRNNAGSRGNRSPQ